jgi:hypothetical protein
MNVTMRQSGITQPDLYDGTLQRTEMRAEPCAIAVESAGDSEDGIRTDGTGKGRGTPVNNGHVRSTKVTRKPHVTWVATL